MHAMVEQINSLLVKAREQAPQGTQVYPAISRLIMRQPISMAEVRRFGKGETVPGIEGSNDFLGDEDDLTYMIEHLNSMMSQWTSDARYQELHARILTVLSEKELEEFLSNHMPFARG